MRPSSSVVRRGQSLDRALQTMKLDYVKNASWKSHSLSGMRSSTLRSIDSLVEVEIMGDKLAKLNTDRDSVAQVEVPDNSDLIGAGCGNIVITQNCKTR